MPQDSTQVKYTEQNVLNNIYESALKAIVVLNAGYTGSGTQLPIADSMAVKITESGTTTYIGIAAPGTAQSASTWQCKKIDESSGMVLTWADGNADFDNVATDLTALTYS